MSGFIHKNDIKSGAWGYRARDARIH